MPVMADTKAQDTKSQDTKSQDAPSQAELDAFRQWQADQEAKRQAEAAANAPVEYYVWLADGNVVRQTADELATLGSHFDGIQIVNKFPVGA